MIVFINKGSDHKSVKAALAAAGVWSSAAFGRHMNALVVAPLSAGAQITAGEILSIDGVEDVLEVASPHPLVDGQGAVAGVGVGMSPVLMAGPCSVESPEQIGMAAVAAAAAGATYLRGGAFKPRTSPYAFQGHGRDALAWMREAADANGLKVVTEVMSERTAGVVASSADVLQIGSRNMANFALLHEVGRQGMPVLLKRGMASTVEEWLLAGEHLLHAGAAGVIFCERGVTGHDPITRNLLDLAAVALMHSVYRQPVIVDPSHATGRRDLIVPMAAAAMAAGADGLIVEYHPSPGEALSDGPQSVTATQLAAVGRIVRGQP